MTPNKQFFATFKMFDQPEKVHVGDGRVVEAVGVGNIHLKMKFRVSCCKPATMYDVQPFFGGSSYQERKSDQI